MDTRSHQHARRRWPRRFAETAIFASLAWLCVETWLVKGIVFPWTIESGSMAPHLVGAHRRVVCPDCRFQFNVDADRERELIGDRHVANCPNCGRAGIELEALPVRAGDRLLVIRQGWKGEPPRRWELAVFRHPDRLDQFCVKRLVGLPGEHLVIRDGDLWIDGKIARKRLNEYRAMAILVSDARFMPVEGSARRNGDEGVPRDPIATWPVGQGLHWMPNRDDTRWTRQAGRFACRGGGDSRIDWLEFRQPLAFEATPSDLAEESEPELDGERRRVAAKPIAHSPIVSASPGDDAALDDPQDPFSETNSLAIASTSQLFNDSVYNPDESRRLVPVYDLIMRCRLQADLYGTLYFHAHDGRDEWLVSLAHREEGGLLHRNGRPQLRFALDRAAQLRMMAGACDFDFVVADQQILLAINGKLLLDFPYQPGKRSRRPVAAPLAVGVEGDNLYLGDVRVFRDVEYEAAEAAGGTMAALVGYHLRDGEYFFLGDNCPHSEDSRHWLTGPGVPEWLILGKPLVLSPRSQ